MAATARDEPDCPERLAGPPGEWQEVCVPPSAALLGPSAGS